MRVKREDGRRFPSSFELVIRLGIQPFSRLMWKPELVNGGRYVDFEKPCFVYGNHSHNYDPFMLNMFTRWLDSTAGVLTQEYFRSKIQNAGMRAANLYPTRKHVPEPHLIRNIYREIQNKRSFLIYPEGGRRWAGQPIPWIESTAKIFAKSQLPVYPVAMYGSYVAWPRWATYPRPGRIKIKVFDPLRFDRKTPLDEVLAKLKAPIDFDENIVDDELKPKWAYRPADGIHRLLYRDPDSGENGGIFTPDGTYVKNATGTINYKMLPDSTMLDEKTGEVFTSATLYKKVKTLPIMPGKDGIVIQNHVHVLEEDQFPDIQARGKGTIKLYMNELVVATPSFKMTKSIDEILYVGIEKNYMLQLFLNKKMIQFNFKEDGSALHWHDTILKLKENQKSANISPSNAAK